MWLDVQHATLLALLDDIFNDHCDSAHEMFRWITFVLNQLEALGEECISLDASLLFRVVAVACGEVTIHK